MLDWHECLQFFITCNRTNIANNATYYVKPGKTRLESFNRNYYIISPRVIIKAIVTLCRGPDSGASDPSHIICKFLLHDKKMIFWNLALGIQLNNEWSGRVRWIWFNHTWTINGKQSTQHYIVSFLWKQTNCSSAIQKWSARGKPAASAPSWDIKGKRRALAFCFPVRIFFVISIPKYRGELSLGLCIKFGTCKDNATVQTSDLKTCLAAKLVCFSTNRFYSWPQNLVCLLTNCFDFWPQNLLVSQQIVFKVIDSPES